MAEDTRDDSREQPNERPKRITLSGRRYGRIAFSDNEKENLEARPDYRPHRDTTERRQAS